MESLARMGVSVQGLTGESGSICNCKGTLDNPAKVGMGHPGAWILATGVEGAIRELAEVEGLVVDKET